MLNVGPSKVETEVTFSQMEGCACTLCGHGIADDGEQALLAEQTARATQQTFDTATNDSDQNIDALLTGSKWATTTLTFSFPDSADDYSYQGYLEVRDTFKALNVAQETAVRTALDFYASVSGLSFQELDGPSDADADLMFGVSNAPPTAFAYYPSSGDAGGDSWFNSRSYNAPEAGNYAWSTFLHEVGHALGLKHGHETFGSGAIAAAYDSHEYSLMTYRSYVGSAGTAYTNGTWSGPQTAMMLDIAAIQRMYGANYDFASDDTTYVFSTSTGQMFANGEGSAVPGGNYVLRTIWDGGGFDTYDLSNYSRDLIVDLSPGGFVDLDAKGNAQRAFLGGGQYAKGHVFNALLFEDDIRSVIEAAVGGSGNDLIRGNAASNRLEGRGGNDTLAGLIGDDTLLGGTGADRFLFELTESLPGDVDLILDLDFAEGDLLDLSGFGSEAFDSLDLDGLVTGTGGVLASVDDLARSDGLDFLTLSATDLGGTLLSFSVGSWTAAIELASINFSSVEASLSSLPVLIAPTPVEPDAPELPDPPVRPVVQQATSFADVMTGGDLGELIKGLSGNDTLSGFGGKDTLSGGDGADLLRGGDAGDILRGDSGRDRLYGQSGGDNLSGGDGADRLAGNGGADRLSGDRGSDLLIGGQGRDLLNGGGGSDTIRGHSGADTLDGGRGADILVGGRGADRFIFGTDSGSDRIKDFGKGNDRLLIEGADRFADLDLTENGNGVIISHEGGTIFLDKTALTDLDASNFIF